MTVGWTVSVTTVFLCNLAAAAAHMYWRASPEQRGVGLLKELLLFAAAVIGAVSLALLPAVLKLRRVPPPRGVVAFAVCVAAAPLLALLIRAVR